LIHAPIALFTQYLIARARQKAIALTLLVAVALNVVLSVVLAYTVGIWGVALSTLVTDLGALAVIAPRLVAPVAGVSLLDLVRAFVRPLLTGLVVAIPVLGLLGRVSPAHHLWELGPLGVVWVAACGAALWRFGIAPSERAGIRREFFSSRGRAAEAIDQV